ncbi:MAG: YbbR-like domain-containing protein [Candidatus Aminicenantes bacterium]|nr:YbbR-like domain-containing protein [Candidatus Aminicenantes bacterium]
MRIREVLFSNFPLKLLSFLFALLLWIVVSGEKKAMVEIMVNTRIGFQNLPKNLEVVDYSPKQVNIRLKVQKNQIFLVDSRSVSLMVDLSSVKEGEEILPLKKNMVILPVPAEVIKITPSFVKVKLGAIERKQVRIKPILIGSPPDWMVFEGYQINPKYAIISGIKESISKISSVYTEPFNLKEAKLDETFKVKIVPPQGAVSLIEPEDGIVLLSFKGREKTVFKTFSVERGNYKIWVKVEGPYSKINSLTKEAITGVEKKGKKLVPVVQLEEGVKLVRYRIRKK